MTAPTDEIERELKRLTNEFEDYNYAMNVEMLAAVSAYIAKREDGLRLDLTKALDRNNYDPLVGHDRCVGLHLDALEERNALRAENEKLREVERAARAFVLAHDSIVVRFQDATLARVYEDRARRLDALLDHYDKGDGP